MATFSWHSVCTAHRVAVKVFVILAVITISVAAAPPGFLLGLDYSESVDYPSQIAVDGAGSAYLLYICPSSNSFYASCLAKLSPDGKTILSEVTVPFAVSAMAVDAQGDCFLAPQATFTQTSLTVFVEKLSGCSSSSAYETPIGFDLSTISGSQTVVLAVDSSGRAFVAGNDASTGQGYLVRLNASGAVDYTTTLNGMPKAIAVNPSGSEVAVQLGISTLAWVSPDSNAVAYSNVFGISVISAAGVAPNGSAVVAGSNNGSAVIEWLAPSGAVTISKTIARGGVGGLALDGQGNVYVTFSLSPSGSPLILNPLEPCGMNLLAVFASDGTLLQSTYTGNSSAPGYIAVTPNSVVYIMGGGTPTQTTPFTELNSPPYMVPASVLTRFSPNPNAQILSLLCATNGATFMPGPVAPGEIVTLFGTQLGPQTGVQAQASLTTPFPTLISDVAVTFNGTPGPLLWVQDTQINAVVPWSTAGSNVEICVEFNAIQTNCLTEDLRSAAPAVFTVDGIHAAAINQDGSLNSAQNPAAVGSTVSVFATGLGPINPPQRDGSLINFPLPVNQIPVSMIVTCPSDGCPTVPVTYGGPAPYLIAGASQINFQANPAPLSVQLVTTLEAFYSNSFQIYVAGQ